MNIDRISNYYLDVTVCSGPAGLTTLNELTKCCEEVRVTAKIPVEVKDENINAPNFQFNIGPTNPVKVTFKLLNDEIR